MFKKSDLFCKSYGIYLSGSSDFFSDFRVRCRAAFILAEVVNRLPETWLGPPALMILFKKLYGCKSAPHIPKPNNFVVTSTNLQLYFLMHVSLFLCHLFFLFIFFFSKLDQRNLTFFLL